MQTFKALLQAVDTSSNYGEADFNVTELTVANSGLDLEVYLNGSSSPGSDSGISDQSPKVEPATEEPLLLIEENAPAQTINRYRHESSAYASSSEDNEDKALLEVHRNGDGTLVIDQTRSSPPAVKLSPSASMKRQAKLKAEADELTVLSQDVIDTALLKSSNAKASANTITAKHQLDEYVPPRAYARREDDEEDYNKGCYYFIACLDSFWIL